MQSTNAATLQFPFGTVLLAALSKSESGVRMVLIEAATLASDLWSGSINAVWRTPWSFSASSYQNFLSVSIISLTAA
jgi:hypothetical protein